MYRRQFWIVRQRSRAVQCFLLINIATMADTEIDDPLFSLSLRPGGSTTSLFSGFGKGAGFGVKPRTQVRLSGKEDFKREVFAGRERKQRQEGHGNYADTRFPHGSDLLNFRQIPTPPAALLSVQYLHSSLLASRLHSAVF